MRSLFLVVLSLFFAVPVQAKEVLGVQFDEHITLGPDQPTLVLNGTAVRRKQQYATYVAGLYLAIRNDSPDKILRDLGPKRLTLFLEIEQVEPDAMVSAWSQGFALNHSREELRVLLPQIERFNKMWTETLKQGDRVAFDYLPGQGTRVTVNDDLLGTVPGSEFYRALLKTFIGPHPVARNVKNGLLGL